MYFSTGAQLQAALNALPATKTGNFVAFDSFFYGQQYMADYQGTLSPIEHFVQIGAARGYKPNATFDPVYYANAFADLKGKGFDSADLLYHFMQYGLDEGRVPNAALANFDGAAYLAAYPDVAAYVNANLDQFGGSATNGALAHYVKFGSAEGRDAPGTSFSNGQTFTLTVGADAVDGTAGNDTINVVYTNQLGTDATTWQAFDSINGGAGVDTMNIYVKGANNSVQAGVVNNVEIVNVFNTEADTFFGGGAGIDASKFVGVQQLWQIDGANDINKLSSSTTAGFRGDGEVSVDIDAAAGSTAINLAFDQTNQSEAYVYVDGTSLNTVNLGGTLTYAGEDDCGNPTVEKGWVNLDVDSGAGSKFTLNSSLNVELDIYASNFTEVDASASTGDIEVWGRNGQLQTITTGSGDDYIRGTGFVTTSTKAATISTGAGDDDVDLATTGAGKTTVNLGDGDDWVGVSSASKTLVINAGAGDDAIWFGEDFQAAGGTVTVDAGDGDDAVAFNNHVMADIAPTWSIKGGAGTDTIGIGAGAGRVFNAGDYVTLTETISGFEVLNLRDYDSGNTFGIDASRLTGYSEINLGGEDSTLVVTKADASKATIGMYGSNNKLVLTAADYAAGATTAYGKDLAANVATFGDSETTLNVRGNSLALNVEQGLAKFVSGADLNANGDKADTGEAAAKNDVKSLSVTLNTEFTYDDKGTPCDESDDVANGIWTTSGVNIDTDNFTTALTTITLDGQGFAFVRNGAGSKLATVNAADFSAVTFNGEGAQIAANALFYVAANGGVAEKVTLGAGIDTILYGSLAASTWAKMDTITGLNLVDNAKVDGKQLDASSDLIKLALNLATDVYDHDNDVDTAPITNPTNDVIFSKLGSADVTAVNGLGSLAQAMSYVAQLDKTAQQGTVFTYGGDTYVFVDTVTSAGDNQLDDGDFAVKLTGIVDLDLLVASLHLTA